MAEINKPDYSKLWSSGGAMVAPSDVKIQTGWTAEVPPLQWENWSQNRQDQAIAHIMQHGIASWDAATEYQYGVSGSKSLVMGSNGTIYRAKQTNINQNPTTDVSNTYWELAFASGTNTYTKAEVDAKTTRRLLNVRVFTAGTYTYAPTVGTNAVDVVLVAGGGSGGNVPATTASQYSAAGGGGGGGYARSFLTSGFSGVTLIVGAGGASGATANGTPSSFGALFSATAGGAANAAVASTTPFVSAGGAGGSGVSGNINNSLGGMGAAGLSFGTLNFLSGAGGGSVLSFGGGGRANIGVGTSSVIGAGGAGAAGTNSAAAAGGAGGDGIAIIMEYS